MFNEQEKGTWVRKRLAQKVVVRGTDKFDIKYRSATFASAAAAAAAALCFVHLSGC